MATTSGWRGDSYFHSLAARGIPVPDEIKNRIKSQRPYQLTSLPPVMEIVSKELTTVTKYNYYVNYWQEDAELNDYQKEILNIVSGILDQIKMEIYYNEKEYLGPEFHNKFGNDIHEIFKVQLHFGKHWGGLTFIEVMVCGLAKRYLCDVDIRGNFHLFGYLFRTEIEGRIRTLYTHYVSDNVIRFYY